MLYVISRVHRSLTAPVMLLNAYYLGTFSSYHVVIMYYLEHYATLTCDNVRISLCSFIVYLFKINSSVSFDSKRPYGAPLLPCEYKHNPVNLNLKIEHLR